MSGHAQAPTARRRPGGGARCARTMLISLGVAAALVGRRLRGCRRRDHGRTGVLRRSLSPAPHRAIREATSAGAAAPRSTQPTDSAGRRRRCAAAGRTADARSRRPRPPRRRRGTPATPAPTPTPTPTPDRGGPGSGKRAPGGPPQHARSRRAAAERCRAPRRGARSSRSCASAWPTPAMSTATGSGGSPVPTRPTASRRCPPTSRPRRSQPGSSPSTATTMVGEEYRWEDAGCWGYAVHVTDGAN